MNTASRTPGEAWRGQRWRQQEPQIMVQRPVLHRERAVQGGVTARLARRWVAGVVAEDGSWSSPWARSSWSAAFAFLGGRGSGRAHSSVGAPGRPREPWSFPSSIWSRKAAGPASLIPMRSRRWGRTRATRRASPSRSRPGRREADEVPPPGMRPDRPEGGAQHQQQDQHERPTRQVQPTTRA